MLEEITCSCVYKTGNLIFLCDAGTGMSDTGRYSVLIIILNLPVYVFLGWVLFRSWAGFWEAVRFLFKPDFWSFLDGERWDDIMAEGKLAIWFIAPLLLIRLQLWLFLDL